MNQGQVRGIGQVKTGIGPGSDQMNWTKNRTKDKNRRHHYEPQTRSIVITSEAS
jgi:hypothetical protein